MLRTNGASVMLRIDQARAFPRALGILLAVSFTAAGSGGVLAKSRVKKPASEPAGVGDALMSPRRRRRCASSPSTRCSPSTTASRGVNPAPSSSHPPIRRPGPTSPAMRRLPSSPLRRPATSRSACLPSARLRACCGQKWRGVESQMRAEAKSVEGCKADEDRCSVAERKFLALTAFRARRRPARPYRNH